MSTSLIILAAGASTRLGQPKQALPYAGQNLLQRTVQVGLASACDEVIVVLGARAAQLQPALAEFESIKVVENQQWEQGMASSLKCGLQVMAKDAAGVILMVCDQPFADAALLNALLQAQVTEGKGIAASAYGNTLGTPVLFTSKYFQALLCLQGHEGAKQLIFKHAQDVAQVAFPKGSVDIDTPEDFKALQLYEQQHT